MAISLADSIAAQICELEDQCEDLVCKLDALQKHYDIALDQISELQDENKELSEELEYYRTTFPEGSDAYACMRRME